MRTKVIIPEEGTRFETFFPLKKGTATAAESRKPATLWLRLTQNGMQNEGMLLGNTSAWNAEWQALAIGPVQPWPHFSTVNN